MDIGRIRKRLLLPRYDQPRTTVGVVPAEGKRASTHYLTFLCQQILRLILKRTGLYDMGLRMSEGEDEGDNEGELSVESALPLR